MKQPAGEQGEVLITASVGKHLAFSPVAFAVTEGPTHALVYANTLFHRLVSAGDIMISEGKVDPFATAADLRPLLDRVFGSSETVRDALIESSDEGNLKFRGTIWPVPPTDGNLGKLVIEVRDVALIEGAKARQREIAERLLLGALREQDAARDSAEATKRAQYLSKTSRDLAMSLDERQTRDTVRKLALPRPGSWCIVDVVESNGSVHRLAVFHPDPAKQELAHKLEDQWSVTNGLTTTGPPPPATATALTQDSGAALMLVAHGDENLAILREIGFGTLLVVPLIVRARVQGAITFVSKAGDPPFTQEEISLAVDVGARCALALDNARLYREADSLKLAAELANKSKSDFLGGMSHELRTPLNAIGGFAELLEMGIGGPVTPEQQVSLARIKANQQHLLGLITEILNFVRIESGRMEYQYAEVPVTKALADVSAMLGPVITQKGLTIVCSDEKADAVAWADPDRVRQILVNLVTNAVKYAGRGVITLTCDANQEEVIAHVTDAGPGIAPDKLASIFEPFVQLASGLAERRGGVGLGLAISRDLARGMGGDLTVQSTEGIGSRFTLSLPRARDRRSQ